MRSCRHLLPALVLLLVLLLVLPVAGQEATPVAPPESEVAVEELCAVVLPPESMPAGEVFLDVWQATLAPGTVLDYPAGTIQDSVAVDCMLAGSYAVRLDGSLSIVSGGRGTPTSVPEGTEATARAGDAVLYLENERPQTIRVVGEAAVVAIGIGVFSTTPPACAPSSCPPLPDGIDFTYLGGLAPVEWARADLPPGPLALAVRRVTLAAGASLPLSAEAWPAVRQVETGTLSWHVVLASGEPASSLSPLVFEPGQPIPWTPLLPERRLLLSNPGDEPATFLEVTLAPAAPAAATPAAATPTA